MLACTKSPWLSRRQQQTLYMVTTNAVPIGQRIGHQQPHEQLEHVLFDSPQAKAFWKLLLPQWARCTPTQSWAASLAASGVADRIGRRAIALGVRPDGEAANQEQWDALRAVAIDALLAQHRANAARVDAGHPPLTAAEAAEAAFAETRAELQKIVVLSHRVAQARTQFNLARPHRVKRGDVARSADAWHDAWIASGLATIKGKPQQCILPPPPSVRQPPPQPHPKAMPPPDALPADTYRHLHGRLRP